MPYEPTALEIEHELAVFYGLVQEQEPLPTMTHVTESLLLRIVDPVVRKYVPNIDHDMIPRVGGALVRSSEDGVKRMLQLGGVGEKENPQVYDFCEKLLRLLKSIDETPNNAPKARFYTGERQVLREGDYNEYWANEPDYFDVDYRVLNVYVVVLDLFEVFFSFSQVTRKDNVVASKSQYEQLLDRLASFESYIARLSYLAFAGGGEGLTNQILQIPLENVQMSDLHGFHTALQGVSSLLQACELGVGGEGWGCCPEVDIVQEVDAIAYYGDL